MTSNKPSVQPPAQQENAYLRLHSRDVECMCAVVMDNADGFQPSRASSRDSGRSTTEDAFDSYMNKIGGRFGCTKPFVLLYHMLCVSIVVFALASDWISIKGGGSVSWELWAFWQHFCLWGLFWQNLLRCYLADTVALQRSTLMTVILYTAPLLSEMADTMKDWIVTGICLQASPTFSGLALGAVFILTDLILRPYIPEAYKFQVFEGVSVWPPLMGMVPIALFCFTLVELGKLLPIEGILFICIWPVLLLCLGRCLFSSGKGLAALGSFVFCCYVCHLVGPLLLGLMTDGAFLYLASTYIMIMAYQMILSNDESSTEVFRSYFGILALPLYKEVRPDGWYDRIRTMVYNKMIGYLSSSRLLIAFSEDGPQGFIGVALTIGHREQVGSLGFAAFSACISVLKAVLIPVGQKIILQHTLWRAKQGLKDTKTFVRTCFADEINLSQLTKNDLKSTWERALEKRERDLHISLNLLHGPSLYRQVYETTAKWKSNNLDVQRNEGAADLLRSVSGVIIKLSRKDGDSVSDIRAKGFELQDCVAANFTLDECIEGGWQRDEAEGALGIGEPPEPAYFQ